MTIHASVEIPNGLCLPEGLRGLLESDKHPFPQSNAERVHSRSVSAGHLHVVLCKLQRAFAPSSMATPRKNGELFIGIADPHLSGQRNLEASNTSLLAFSPGLSCRCAFQEWGRQSRWTVGWRAQNTSQSPESSVIAVHPAPTDDCAQLRDFKLNCHKDRLSDGGDFLMILS